MDVKLGLIIREENRLRALERSQLVRRIFGHIVGAEA
jgi:hypothetical protein